jgi:hypothetical protein
MHHPLMSSSLIASIRKGPVLTFDDDRIAFVVVDVDATYFSPFPIPSIVYSFSSPIMIMMVQAK